MKRLFGFYPMMAMMIIAAMLITSCFSDSDFFDQENGTENGNSGNENSDSGSSGSATTYNSSLSDLTGFDIAIDKTALSESETIPTEGDEAEDFIENNSFKNEVDIAFNGSSASTSGSVDGVTVAINGADVVVKSSAKKVCYNVSGTTTNGFLKIYSDNKFELNLNGVSITNPDGTIRVITTGKQFTYGRLDTPPKGMKSDGAMLLKGGTIMVRCTGGEGSEGIESKSTMNISGGNIMAYCYDDAINSSGAMTISGGNVFAMGTNNDGIDSNSTLTVSGGVVIACGTTQPEEGFDCDQNSFAVTGGILIGIGGTTSTPTTSVTTQPVAILGGSSIQNGQYITVADDSGSNILVFKVPRDYTQQGYTLLVSSPKMTKGNSYIFSSGATVSGGNDFCGYVTDATVSGGSSLATLTLSQMITTSNFSGGMGGGGTQPGGGQPGGNGGNGGGPGGGGQPGGWH